jgi:hypothetical protein
LRLEWCSYASIDSWSTLIEPIVTVDFALPKSTYAATCKQTEPIRLASYWRAIRDTQLRVIHHVTRDPSAREIRLAAPEIRLERRPLEIRRV